MHKDDFEDLPDNICFIMVLETCNISASIDVKGEEKDLSTLQLSSFPGENISAFATAALKLIKVMNSAYSLLLRTGSDLLNKITKQSSDYFNRTIFNHLDNTYQMEETLSPLWFR